MMARLYGSSGDEAKDMEAKETLIESSLAQVFAEYDYAKKRRMRDPVVFLVDCEDEIGGPMARGWEGDEVVDAAIEESVEDADDDDGDTEKDDEERCITALARAFSLEDCRREMPQFFPDLMPTFESPYPQDGFLAVVVTAGGAATFTVPHSAR
jgi:hypothetical protein